MNKFHLLSILFLAALAGGALLYRTFSSDRESTLPAPNPDHQLLYSGAVPYFAAEEALESLRQNVSNLATVTAFIYFLGTDGAVVRREEVREEIETEIVRVATQADREVLVGIENDEDPDVVNALLQDTDARQRHITEIVKLTQAKGYDGVTVDYENLQPEQTRPFIRYMKELSAALHSAGKKVAISVNTETKGRVFHGIDVVALAPLVDRLELNAYEEFGEDTVPGPIASLGWAPGKIVLGTAHAGHDWLTSGTTEFFQDTTAAVVLERQRQAGAALRWDDARQAHSYGYRDGKGKQHVVWVEDARSFQAKVDLAKRYKLQGVFLWHLGGEDPNVWRVAK
jgi:spore germination protein YaaH